MHPEHSERAFDERKTSLPSRQTKQTQQELEQLEELKLRMNKHLVRIKNEMIE